MESAVAAGVLRYCQKHGETSLRLKGAVCGDGPEAKLKALENAMAKNALTAGDFTPGKGFTSWPLHTSRTPRCT